ncbi:hypothetical protein EW146_g1395 [Bondarzewia mesenterica]|uniref:Nephrocystin 3-like N-terminal domain-containing protein n=1 Tax=Bondarzewia mesenterica TaxID=1095465 RepID=A0A4S4M4H4_9AGAM|nr:hypothetical protein EW146_g1395 [Bondarzewia mesenterica]
MRPYQAELPPDLRHHLDGLTRAFEGKKYELEKKIRRSVLVRSLEASGDAQDIVQGFRYISCAIEIFMLGILLGNSIAAVRMNTAITKAVRNATLDKLCHVAGAEFNLEDREGCMEGTRIALLADLLIWATDDHSPRLLAERDGWYRQDDHRGESFARLLHQKGLLGASFFCSRQGSAERRNARRIFPTLARVMARNSSAFERTLVEAVESNPNAAELSLGEQFATLIAEPAKSASRESTVTCVAVVDALDECEDPDVAKKVLDIIIRHAPGSHMEFFVTSRPEPSMRAAFVRPTSHLHSVLRLHDVEVDIVKADIELYLKKRLGDIPQLSADVQHSGGTLGETLHLRIHHVRVQEAFKGIDKDEASETARTLAAIVCVRDPLSIADLQKLLGCKNNQTSTDPKRSGSQKWTFDSPHAHGAFAHDCSKIMNLELRFNVSGIQNSYFGNQDQEQSTGLPRHLVYACQFWADHLAGSSAPQELLADVEVFLRDKYLYWLDFMSIFGKVPDATSALLKIARVSCISRDLEVLLNHFNHFVMTYRDPIVLSATHIYISALPFSDAESSLTQIFHSRFPRTLAVNTSTARVKLQYCVRIDAGNGDSISSVAYLPDGKRIVSNSGDNTIRVWDAETGEAASKPFEGHTSTVSSVAFSPDGKRIVSGSDDNTIRVWEAETGNVVRNPVDGHRGHVLSALLPQVRYPSSASGDHDNHTDTSVRESLHDDESIGSVMESSAQNPPLLLPMAFSPHKIHAFDAAPLFDGIDATHASNLSMEDGWVVGPRDELLFWVPPDLCAGLFWPGNTAVTGRPWTKLDLSRFVHGTEWMNCFSDS